MQMLSANRCFGLFRLIFYRLQFFFVLRNAIGEIILPPSDEEALVSQTVIFKCRSNIKTQFPVAWYHQQLGRGKYDELVYEDGEFSNGYKDPNNYEISGNTSEGEFNLVILNVKLEAAGKYTCTDTSRSERRAELIVYESYPSCLRYRSSDNFVGVNECGIAPDTLRLSCNVSYQGNLQPMLEWKNGGENLPNADTKTNNSNIMSSIELTADEIRSPNFQCGVRYLTSNIESKIFCRTTVRLLDTKIKTYNVSCKESPIQSIDCAFETFYNCSYSWKKSISSWSDSGPILNLTSADEATVYICQAECLVRNTMCSFTPAKVAYTCDMNDNESPNIPTILVVIAVILLIIAATVVIVILLKKRRRHELTAVQSEEVNL